MKGKSAGFTLMELVVATAIGALVVAAASPAVYQILTGSEKNNNRVTALRQVQDAGTWISGDALRAMTVTVSVGNGFPLSFTWGQLWPGQGSSYVSTQYTVTYVLQADTLIRQERLETTTFDDTGTQQGPPTITDTATPVAQYLVSAAASWSEGRVGVTMTARFPLTGSRYVAEETRTYDTRPRPG